VGKPGDEGYDDLDKNDPNYDSEGEEGLTILPEDTIFDKIVRQEIPCNKVYEDDLVLAFNDINPQAPTHILLIPKDRKGMSQLRFAGPKHEELLGHMMLTVGEIVKQQNLSDYRVVVNDGEGAGQTVFHLHLHILAGRPLVWPPG
jgi:histidine triad (HIT) family protein